MTTHFFFDHLDAFDDSIDLIVGTIESLTKTHVKDFFLNFRQSYGNSGELFLLVLDEAQVLLEEREFRELSRIKYLILRSFKKVISLGATSPQNFATVMEEKLLLRLLVSRTGMFILSRNL